MKRGTDTLFVWLISHQPAVVFHQNKPNTSNQPTVLFSHNKSAPAISHQSNDVEEVESTKDLITFLVFFLERKNKKGNRVLMRESSVLGSGRAKPSSRHATPPPR
jgi:hypothetical protein